MVPSISAPYSYLLFLRMEWINDLIDFPNHPRRDLLLSFLSKAEMIHWINWRRQWHRIRLFISSELFSPLFLSLSAKFMIYSHQEWRVMRNCLRDLKDIFREREMNEKKSTRRSWSQESSSKLPLKATHIHLIHLLWLFLPHSLFLKHIE